MDKLSPEDRRLLVRLLRELPDMRTTRSRMAFVENAVAGYPRSDQLLANLDWEGAPNVVTSDLVRWCQNFEVADEINALALLVNTVVPLLSSEDRDALQEMIHRNGWGGDSPSESRNVWHDPRSPAEVTQERIIGEDTLRHINYLQKALRAADAVVRICVPGKSYGTGFMVAPDLMLTNHHVIGTVDEATRAEVAFHYEFDILGQKHEETIVGTTAHALLVTDSELDFSVIALDKPPAFGQSLTIRPVRMEKNQRVAIIQHPGGFLKKVSLQNNFVAYADDRLIQYYTSTQAGSSGSPVFDDDFCVVGIHHSYVGLKKSDPDERHFRNQGSGMIAVLEAIQGQMPALTERLTIQD